MIFLIPLLVCIPKLVSKDNKPKVVVVLKAVDREYWRLFESGANKAFDDFHIDGKVVAPDSTYQLTKQLTKQMNILKSVMRENPDALIVTPIQSSPIIPILEEYKKKTYQCYWQIQMLTGKIKLLILAQIILNWENKQENY